MQESVNARASQLLRRRQIFRSDQGTNLVSSLAYDTSMLWVHRRACHHRNFITKIFATLDEPGARAHRITVDSSLVGPFHSLLTRPRKSSMTSFVRPIVASLLCAMAVIGHAPSWLHVAGCDSEKSRQLSGASGPEGSDCHHGCCHHASPVADRPDAEESSQKPDDHRGDHDADTCALCQSLGLPNGVTWKLDLPSIVLLDLGVAKIPSLAVAESTSLSIPRPRGPPAHLA